MGKRWRQRGPADTINEAKEDAFVEKHDEYELLCANCHKPLLKIVIIRDLPLLSRIKSNCPFCGDSSFIKELSGQFALDNAKGVVMINTDTKIDEDKENNIVIQTLNVTVERSK
jgi:hypothetical protein